MRKTLITIAVAGLVVSVANAAHDEPAKAGKYQSEVVTGYQECTTSTPDNDSNSDSQLPLPACSAAQRNDTLCGLGNLGSGKIQVQADKNGDLKIQGTIKGVTCEGETLCAVATARVTTDDCLLNPANGCTVRGDLTTDFNTNVCGTVVGGVLKIKGTLENGLGFTAAPPLCAGKPNKYGCPGAVVVGKNTGFELYRSGVVRTSGVAPAGPAFVAGVVVK